MSRMSGDMKSRTAEIFTEGAAAFRRMRAYNPIPNRGGVGYRNARVLNMVEDPNFRDSADSQYVQACDLIAYLLHQQLTPNSYMRKRGGANYFQRLDPILCKVASRTDPQGIVRL